MAMKVIERLTPPSDLAQDIGKPTKRWKTGYFEKLSDGMKTVNLSALTNHLDGPDGTVHPHTHPLSDVSGLTAALDVKAVTNRLTLYIRTGGDDSRDGLSEATAVRTPGAAMALLGGRYAGFIENCTLDFGAGLFPQMWSPFDAPNTAFGDLRIKGAGMDSTFLGNTAGWSNGFDGRFAKVRCVTVSDLTFAPAADMGGIMVVHNLYLVLQNIHIDMTNAPNRKVTTAIVIHRGSQGSVRGSFVFTGVCDNLFDATISPFCIEQTCKFTLSAGSVVNRAMFRGSANDILIAAYQAGYLPDYQGTLALYFANLWCGARVIFQSEAAKTAWMNGKNSTYSTSWPTVGGW